MTSKPSSAYKSAPIGVAALQWPPGKKRTAGPLPSERTISTGPNPVETIKGLAVGLVSTGLVLYCYLRVTRGGQSGDTGTGCLTAPQNLSPP
jgi:hypothetical protein